MRVRPLDETTWPDFAGLVERHNGVWGGCWCMGFHAEGVGRTKTAAQNRAEKEGRVREGRAHAALVYDGATCVGWCQFGPTDELPRIKHRRAYLDGLGALPDWRITCFFVDRELPAQRASPSAALDGALDEIARLGGGTVESYPEDAEGRSVSAVVPPQRHRGDVRAPRLRAHPPPRQAPLGGQQSGALSRAAQRTRRSPNGLGVRGHPLLEGARLLPAETLIDAALRPRSGARPS